MPPGAVMMPPDHLVQYLLEGHMAPTWYSTCFYQAKFSSSPPRYIWQFLILVSRVKKSLRQQTVNTYDIQRICFARQGNYRLTNNSFAWLPGSAWDNSSLAAGAGAFLKPRWFHVRDQFFKNWKRLCSAASLFIVKNNLLYSGTLCNVC
eukprot:1139150-Pelagomonas_calceolata.AAC.1